MIFNHMNNVEEYNEKYSENNTINIHIAFKH